MGCDRIGLGHAPAAANAAPAPRPHDAAGGGVRDDDDDDDGERDRVVPLPYSTRYGYGPRDETKDNDDAYSDDTDLEEEMMRIDPVDREWRRQLHIDDPVDAQNVFGNWCPALILRLLDGDAQVRYLNMNPSWQRWVPVDSGQLAPPATKTRNDSPPLRLAQAIEVRKPGHAMWKEAHVVRVRASDVMVRYAGREQQFDEWIPFGPETVAAAGAHIRTRALSHQRRLSVRPTANRSRVIQAQNPRFRHYQEALAAQGLRIHAVEGDGNCLFRAVSHQVYGDDGHHGLVRRLCMDYMESEKEYFEPYVVGDMAAYLRYLAHKRRDGVWGDDPEIQAMCELYDRPAEVYAYDPTRGFQKLRTFHESSSVSRNRPPICLSYYGGGHYDSLVGPLHMENVIHEPPGNWEARHIEYSRRINTREQGTTTSMADEDGGVAPRQRHATMTDREQTEMAHLEHTLMLSRNEFDAMNASLDETLKHALAESTHTAVASEQRAVDAATRESEMAAIQAELIEKARQASEEELMRKAIAASLHEHAEGDFDAQVSAAIEASLTPGASTMMAGAGVSHEDDDEEMRRALELSAKEFEETTGPPPSMAMMEFGMLLPDDNANMDEMDELQRAIQASLERP